MLTLIPHLRPMKIAHLSDLHFGAIEPEAPAALREALLQAAPELVVVSGDLSQTGTSAELREARAFLDSIPIPQLIVPGNHDMPRGWRLWDRFRRPWHHYRKIVSEDLEPVITRPDLLVIGTNSARSAGWNADWSQGRISHWQLDRIRQACVSTPPSALRVLVIHHPPAGPDTGTHRALLGRRQHFFEAISHAGIDLVLSGHFHTSYAIPVSLPGADPRNCVLSVTSTATSHRRKGEPNGFHLIEGGASTLKITRWQVGPTGLQPAHAWHFQATAPRRHWSAASADETGAAAPSLSTPPPSRESILPFSQTKLHKGTTLMPPASVRFSSSSSTGGFSFVEG
ncbi:MAG: putative 3,5-cyclic-nucleotide phosphodiesterase [Verrucomicrobiales bacterium]|nr:putative 3,5-cyclic-nucleotide phosphodiesterase [Verrucomicrobiales bacterium]